MSQMNTLWAIVLKFYIFCAEMRKGPSSNNLGGILPHISTQRLFTFVLIASVLTITTVYNNCSQVNFTPTPEALLALEQEAANNDGKPSILINNGDEYTTSKDVVLSLKAGAPATEMYITHDSNCENGSWETYKTSRTWTLNSLNANASVYVKYRTDEGETPCLSDSIVHDDVPPTIEFARPSGQVLKDKSYAINYTATDNISGIAQLLCKLPDRLAFSPCQNSLQTLALSEGTQMIFVKAIDKAGNISTPYSHFWTVDFTPPSVFFIKTPNTLTPIALATFEFDAVDNASGVKFFECHFDNQAWQGCVSPSSQTVNDGPHVFEVRAYDFANNVSEVLTYKWSVDANAPNVVITQAPPPFVNLTSVSIHFRGDDNGNPINIFECKLDNNQMGACLSPITITALKDGLHKFEVRGRDAAENWSGFASTSWFVDTIAPIVSIASAPSLVSNSMTANFQFAGFDENGSGVAFFECRLNTANFAKCNNVVNFSNLTNGFHQLQVRAVDSAGNTSGTVNYNWTIDTVAPVVTVNGPPPFVNTLIANFTFSATDNIPGDLNISCQVNGTGFQTCLSPLSVSVTAEGPQSFFVRASDQAGNSSATAIHTWTVDLTPPLITLLKEPKNIFVGEATSVLFSVEDKYSGVDSVSCKLNNLDISCQANLEKFFNGTNVGANVLEIRARDKLGHESIVTRAWEVTNATEMKVSSLKVLDDRPIDILFIIDISGSMDVERQNLATRINGFINKLLGLNWKIGIVTTEPGTDPHDDGRLAPLRFGTTIISPSKYTISPQDDPIFAQKTLADTMMKIPKADPAQEQGLLALKRAIERATSSSPNLTILPNPNPGFFRDNADLAAIVLSDENESGLTKAQDVLNVIGQTWGANKRFTFHSIIFKPGDTSGTGGTCPTGRTNGYEYASLSEKTGSGIVGGAVIGSICAPDYTTMLEKIGQSVKDIRYTADLACEPLDLDNNAIPDLIIKFKSPAASDYTILNLNYQVSGIKVTFENPLTTGDYNFEYRCIAN